MIAFTKDLQEGSITDQVYQDGYAQKKMRENITKQAAEKTAAAVAPTPAEQARMTVNSVSNAQQPVTQVAAGFQRAPNGGLFRANVQPTQPVAPQPVVPVAPRFVNRAGVPAAPPAAPVQQVAQTVKPQVIQAAPVQNTPIVTNTVSQTPGVRAAVGNVVPQPAPAPILPAAPVPQVAKVADMTGTEAAGVALKKGAEATGEATGSAAKKAMEFAGENPTAAGILAGAAGALGLRKILNRNKQT